MYMQFFEEDPVISWYEVTLIVVAIVLLGAIMWSLLVIWHNAPVPGSDMMIPQQSSEMQMPADLFPTQVHDVKG